MTFGIGFILLLLCLGGSAAYIGDRVGMAVGRNRLTIFGLRPKYTSRIVTIITGVIIVSLTMTSLLLISHSARQSLFGLEELQSTVAHLAGQVSSLERHQQSLILESEALQEQNVALRDENEGLEQRRAELETANATLREEQEWLESRIELITGSSMLIYENLKNTRLLYQANDMIASYVIDVPETREQLIQQVEDVLAQLNDDLLQAGAGEQSPGWGLLLEQVTVDETGEITILSQEDHIQEIVEVIWSEPDLDSVVMQVFSRSHALEGSPVELDFRFYTNQLVFSAGETVAARVFDGREPGSDLLNQVWMWLERDVRQSALENGMLESVDGTVTTAIEPGMLFELVENIMAVQNKVQVRAVAQENVYTSDELPLHFTVEDISTGR